MYKSLNMSGGSNNRADELAKLKELYKNSTLTKQAYEAAKKLIDL